MSYLQDDPPLPSLESLFPHIDSNPSEFPDSVDPFTITTTTGFLPCRSPMVNLPDVFSPLTKLLEEMSIVKSDGGPGLLAEFKLGPLIDEGALPDLTDKIDDLVTSDGSADLYAITAAFRDYSFLASAYLLEPCWESWCKDHNQGYGLGRAKLPHCIAGPLYKTAEILDIPAFMSYAASYALYNYSLANLSVGPSVYQNLRLIRAFERGLDPTSSEAGFILTHIHMVQETGSLISGVIKLLSIIEDSPEDTTAAESAFQTMLNAMTKIESAMEAMWSHSLPKEYLSYRTFIFGITNQSMFPNGVIYEGVNNNNPMYFRGESGANDSIIPLLDHLLEVPMPQNPLTEILKDFRSYRPKSHRLFLSYIMSKAAEVGVREYCRKDPNVAILYLKLLDHVRSFRWRHWLFAREYIIKRSSHPTATGGSPIVTWLPNQLIAVMDLMDETYIASGLKSKANEDAEGMKFVKEMMQNVEEQKVKLAKEVRKYCEERGV